METVLDALLPIFAVIGLGILAGRTGRMDNTLLAPLNTLVMDFALPAAMFAAIARTSRPVLLSQGPHLFVLAVGMLSLWVLTFLVWRRLFGGSRGNAAVIAISVALPNFAAAGVPLMTALFGTAGTLQVSAAIAVGAVLLSPLTLILLDLDAAATAGSAASPAVAIAAAAGRVSRAPLVLAPLVAVALVLAPLVAVALVLIGIHLPEPILRVMAVLGAASGGVALFLTGLVLSARRPRFTVGVVVAVLVAALMHPAIAFGLGCLAGMHGQPFVAAVLLATLPSGFFGIFFALRYRQDVAEAASIVAFCTCLSVLTLAVAIAAFGV